MMRDTHTPIDRSKPDRAVVDCACGFRGDVWCHTQGARTAYLEHVAESIIEDAEWPGELDHLEYLET